MVKNKFKEASQRGLQISVTRQSSPYFEIGDTEHEKEVGGGKGNKNKLNALLHFFFLLEFLKNILYT